MNAIFNMGLWTTVLCEDPGEYVRGAFSGQTGTHVEVNSDLVCPSDYVADHIIAVQTTAGPIYVTRREAVGMRLVIFMCFEGDDSNMKITENVLPFVDSILLLFTLLRVNMKLQWSSGTDGLLQRYGIEDLGFTEFIGIHALVESGMIIHVMPRIEKTLTSYAWSVSNAIRQARDQHQMVKYHCLCRDAIISRAVSFCFVHQQVNYFDLKHPTQPYHAIDNTLGDITFGDPSMALYLLSCAEWHEDEARRWRLILQTPQNQSQFYHDGQHHVSLSTEGEEQFMQVDRDAARKMSVTEGDIVCIDHIKELIYGYTTNLHRADELAERSTGRHFTALQRAQIATTRSTAPGSKAPTSIPWRRG